MPRHPTIKDNRSPAKSRPRRRYFGAPLPSTSRGEGAALAARRRAEATSTGASTSQTFTILGATSRTIDASVAAQLHLRYVRGLIVYLFAFNSSSIGASARLLRRLRALSLSSGAVVCAAGGHGGPSPSSSACSGGSSDGTPSARARATRPQSPRAGPYLLSPLSLPATHSSPAGAGRCGRRLRATPRERGPSPASCCRHRRARWRGQAAVASRCVCDREGSGERGGRPHSSSCAHM